MENFEGEYNTGDIIESKYRIEGLIGKGGMGRVYQVTHTTLGKTFALKVMSSEKGASNSERSSADSTSTNLIRFQREAKALAILNHPNIVMIVDYGVTEQKNPYIVMEYIEGITLRERLEQGPLSQQHAIQIAKQVASGLQAAHLKEIVHRDLKPENIILQVLPDGEMMARVLDFGIAKSSKFGGSLDGDLTGDNVAGTMKYMAYEQIMGEEITCRTDIFALCCITYEMLTGVTPSCLKVKVEPLHSLRGDIPLSLSAVIHKGLSKSSEFRHATMLDLKRDLENIEYDEVVESIEKSKFTLNKQHNDANLNVSSKTYVKGKEQVNTGGKHNFPTNENNRNNTGEYSSQTHHNTGETSGNSTSEVAYNNTGRVTGSNTNNIIGANYQNNRSGSGKYILAVFALLILTGGFFAYPYLMKNVGGEVGSKQPSDKLPESAIPTVIKIKGGTFNMGTNKGDQYAQPEHEVIVKDFSLGGFLVTNHQYYEFVKRANYHAPTSWQGSMPPNNILEKPVTQVTWIDAAAYCQWLSLQTGKTYTLPTEAQWEYTARNYAKLGINEILENYLEWTSTTFAQYPGAKAKINPMGDNVHVFRGKSAESVKDPVTFRFFQLDTYSFNNLGFRVVLNSD